MPIKTVIGGTFAVNISSDSSLLMRLPALTTWSLLKRTSGISEVKKHDTIIQFLAGHLPRQ